MNTRILKQTMAILLALVFVTSPVWAKRIKTDGKNKNSPVSVMKLDFMDSGYGNPGPNSEIRVSTVVKNGSKEDDLKNVVIKLQLKNLAGEVVQEWTKNMPVFKKGSQVEFDPGGIYYNYSFNNLQAAVEIEHDEVVKEKEEGKK